MPYGFLHQLEHLCNMDTLVSLQLNFSFVKELVNFSEYINEEQRVYTVINSFSMWLVLPPLLRLGMGGKREAYSLCRGSAGS